MPQGVLELHPYLKVGENCPNPRGLILGTFPVYECTNHSKTWSIDRSDGTKLFFYGSKDNDFWLLYKKCMAPTFSVPVQPGCALLSMYSRGIAISDLLKSSYRYNKERKTGRIKNEYSSDDSALQGGEWNNDGVFTLFDKGVTKVLCTSKGVLDALTCSIICKAIRPGGKVLAVETSEFHRTFITNLGGTLVGRRGEILPIAKVYRINGGPIITALALPSPGSPQRQLAEFGWYDGDWAQYSNNYFQQAFDWLTE